MILTFVYLGDKLPKYVLTNMSQVAKRFPSYSLVFIGDTKKVCEKVKSLGFNVWLSQDPEASWAINRNSLTHDPEFRDGFWFKTLARFFALNEFLRQTPYETCLLIESDVWVSPNFPMPKFESLTKQIAFPMTTSKQGVASTFFVKDQKSLQHFLDFAEFRVKKDPSSTDVTILAEYYEMHPDKTMILPSGPISHEGYNNGIAENEQSLYSDQSTFQGQIFDASTWGQFLTGEDPRNSWGYRILYRVQRNHAVNPAVFVFSNQGSSIQASLLGYQYEVNSLHVHSKDIRIFGDDSFVLTRLSDFKSQTRKEVVWRYFVRFLPSRAKYLIKNLVLNARKVVSS
jgi:hypothetical protein